MNLSHQLLILDFKFQIEVSLNGPPGTMVISNMQSTV